MSPHLDKLSLFRANPSLFLLLNAACFAEKQQILMLQFLVWPDQGYNPWSTTLDASTLISVSLMRFKCKWITKSLCTYNYLLNKFIYLFYFETKSFFFFFKCLQHQFPPRAQVLNVRDLPHYIYWKTPVPFWTHILVLYPLSYNLLQWNLFQSPSRWI